MVFAICNGHIHQFGILGLLRCRQDERGVGCGILGLVFSDGCEIAGVTNDSRARGFKLFERARHLVWCLDVLMCEVELGLTMDCE